MKKTNGQIITNFKSDLELFKHRHTVDDLVSAVIYGLVRDMESAMDEIKNPDRDYICAVGRYLNKQDIDSDTGEVKYENDQYTIDCLPEAYNRVLSKLMELTNE